MADNVAITAGSGTTIATDEKTINSTAVQVQRMNLSVGKDGSYVGDTSGRLVDGDANASALFIDPRFNSGRIAIASGGLTTATTAYSADDQLGTIFTFTSAARASAGTGLITGATLLDKAVVVGAVDLYLFNQSVTLASDNAQADFSDSDMDNCLGIISFTTPTKSKASPSNAISTLSGLAVPYECVGSTSLFGALVTRSAHTFFGAVTDIKLSLFVQKD